MLGASPRQAVLVPLGFSAARHCQEAATSLVATSLPTVVTCNLASMCEG